MGIHKTIALIVLLCTFIPAVAIAPDYEENPDMKLYAATILEEDIARDESSDGAFILLYPVYEPVKATGNLAWLRQADLPQVPAINAQRGMERKKKCWDVSFCPYVKRGGRYYRLVSFEWGLQPDFAPTNKPNVSIPTYATATKTLNDPSRYADHSRLSQGNWLKISVPSTGIYSISFNTLEKNGIDPAKAQIYGYGGQMLAEDFSKPYIDDLPAVPVYRDEKNSRLVFFGKGPLNWTYSSGKSMFERNNNPYSTKGYYFAGERAEGTLSVETISSTSAPTVKSSSYTDLQLHEKDLYNLGKTGRECYGEDFITSATQKYTFDVDNALTSEPSRIAVDFAARSTSSSTVGVYIDEESLASMTISSISADNSYTYAYDAQCLRTFTPSEGSKTMTVTISYKSGGTVKAAHLNYISLNVRKQLVITGNTLLFRDPSSVKANSTCQFTLQGADASTIILDVTDPQAVKLIEGNYSDGQYTFTADCSTLHEYAAVKLGETLTEATSEGHIENQDLHATPQPDLVIIAPEEFLQQAQRLAEAHRQYDGIDVTVVTAQEVYNEFSSGTPDATAYRRFMKMFYDRASDDDEMPQSLLLFGDGVYDNRLVTNTFKYLSNKPNKLLTFESEESLEGTSSFVSDDYFGFLDDTEGKSLSSDKLDIGVGRFPVNTAEDATIAVDKAISYLKNKDKGTWKNTTCFMADDGDDNSHVTHANTLADLVTAQHPEFIVNKIFVDAFNRVSTVSGTTTPDANKRFMSLLTSGLLLLNYSGHGSTTSWTAEGLLTHKDIIQMRNTRLPLWITATCDFCRYDDSETSGGEYVFLNANGGAIALITTSRIVYSGPNFTLNKAVISNVFNRSGNQRLTLGEVMRQTKRSSTLQSDRNKLNFALIGDPALKLGYPEYRAVVTRMNGHEVDALHIDTAKAMSRVEIEGAIIDSEGDTATYFNGTVQPTVFDASVLSKTLGNDGNDVFTYKDRSNILYTGKSTVKDGRFKFSFIVPNDQSYSYKSGLINLYASTESSPASESQSVEAQGVFEGFVLGGTLSEAAQDSIGPAIDLYLNDYSFKEGGCVNASPTLIATLSDTSGLNTSSSGIGHDIVLTVDGVTHYILNDSFESTVNSCTSGSVYYNLSNLSEGNHTLALKAWDMRNNSTTKSISFRVKAGQSPAVDGVEFHQTTEKAWFSFNHNRPQGWLSVKMEVFDIAGRLVWQSTTEMFNRTNAGDAIEWDYTGEGGREIGNGVYVCRLSATDGDGAQCISSIKIFITTQ